MQLHEIRTTSEPKQRTFMNSNAKMLLAWHHDGLPAFKNVQMQR